MASKSYVRLVSKSKDKSPVFWSHWPDSNSHMLDFHCVFIKLSQASFVNEFKRPVLLKVRRMKIIFDPAVGINVGYGHLKRCEAIAEELIQLAHEVDFVISDKKFDSLIDSTKFRIVRAINNRKYNMIVLDKYNIAKSSLSTYKQMCDVLVRIDDASPTRIIDKVSDVIINGNPYANKGIYETNVKKDCLVVAGPDFVPMSNRFCDTRKKYKVRHNINKVLITFGGSKIGVKYAQRICMSLLESKPKFGFLILNAGETSITSNQVRFIGFKDDIERIMFEVDIAITSSGSTCWQLAAIGVPFIAFKIASNQRKVFEYLLQKRVGIALPMISMNRQALTKTLDKLTYTRRKKIWMHTRSLIDCGGSKRIAKLLHSQIR